MELTTKDYRTTNDGVYVADVGFKKQLWTIDPDLDVVWDWGSHKWEVWKFPGQPKKLKKKMDDKAHHVMTIQTKDRTFRELGAVVQRKLHSKTGALKRGRQLELISNFEARNSKQIRMFEKTMTVRV